MENEEDERKGEGREEIGLRSYTHRTKHSSIKLSFHAGVPHSHRIPVLFDPALFELLPTKSEAWFNYLPMKNVVGREANPLTTCGPKFSHFGPRVINVSTAVNKFFLFYCS